MSATAPDDESVVTALLAVRAKDSKLGIPKIHSLLKSQNSSSGRSRVLIQRLSLPVSTDWQLSLDVRLLAACFASVP